MCYRCKYSRLLKALTELNKQIRGKKMSKVKSLLYNEETGTYDNFPCEQVVRKTSRKCKRFVDLADFLEDRTDDQGVDNA